MSSKKDAIIMRGGPGTGKSTRAKDLAGEEGVIHSTDNYFYQDGVYAFDPSHLREYHERNFAAFCESLEQGVPTVICDNTNVQHWQFDRYVDAAKKAGYSVEIVTMPHLDPEVAAKRTIHGVPVDTIRKMMGQWQD